MPPVVGTSSPIVCSLSSGPARAGASRYLRVGGAPRETDLGPAGTDLVAVVIYRAPRPPVRFAREEPILRSWERWRANPCFELSVHVTPPSRSDPGHAGPGPF